MPRTVAIPPRPRPPTPPRSPRPVAKLDLGIPTTLEQVGRTGTARAPEPIGLVELPRVRRQNVVRAPAYDVVLGVAARTGTAAPPRTALATPPAQPHLPELRVLAQNIVTRKWLHPDVPISGLSIVKTLSGPQRITGKLAPVIPDIADAGFTPWSTRFVVEDESGQVRASAILQPPFAIDGDERSVDAAGVSAYAQRETYDSEYTSTGVDPLDVVRMLWTHILTKPGRAALAVTVGKATSRVRIGGYAPAANSGLSGPQTADSSASSSSDTVPAYTLSWWESPKCGAEIDELARQVPFDYVEQQWWNADRTDVHDHIELAWPRLGRRRTDLRFAEGENVIDKIAARQRDEDLVSVVRVRGAGEGRTMILGQASRPTPDSLPVVLDIQDSTVTSPERAKARAEAELRRRSIPLAIEKVLLDARHPHAPWGSFDEGDDILVQVEIDWLGRGRVVALWHRIVGFTYTPDEEAVAVDLVPSQAFRYGSDD